MVADDAEQPDGAQEQALQDDEEAALMLDVAAGDAEADDGTPGDVVAAPVAENLSCLLYTSPSPRDRQKSRMPSSA